VPPIMYRLARAAIGCGDFFQLARAVVAQKEIGHWPHPPADLIRSGSSEMTDRLAQLESAFRAQNALIVEAQAEITRYLTKEIESAELIDRLIRLLDGPQQRQPQQLARRAPAERIAAAVANLSRTGAIAFSNDMVTDAEIKTLEQVKIGHARHTLPAEALDSLIRWGLVKEATGGLVLTQQGKWRLKVRRITFGAGGRPG
jgi:CheY-like chemotaxis protein